MTARPHLPAEFPKLPPLDPENQKTVARSLVGRVLGFGRTYALLVVGWVGAVFLLDRTIAALVAPFWLPEPARRVAAFAIATIPALWLAYTQHPRARPSLFVQTEKAKAGYFRVGPYEDIEKDRRAFQRADGDHERVLDWLMRREGGPLYLSGDSGTGKSSLLQSFVLPALRSKGWTALVTRSHDDPEAALRRVIGTEPTEAADIRALLLTKVPRRAGAGLLLVVDQFEEFPILQGTAPADALRRLHALLDRLAGEPIKGLRLLLVLRKDYEPFIERLGLPQLRHGDNWRQVSQFVIADARSFVANSGLGLPEPEIARLLAGAADLDGTPGLIRPVTLNMLGFILSTGRASWDAHRSADALLRSYIRDTLQHPSISIDATRLLRQLVTDVGTKRSRTLDDLVATAGLDPVQARTMLLNLQAAGLVRPLGEAQESWEVSHDFVARLLEREMGRPRRQLPRRMSRGIEAKEARRVAEAQARSTLADLGVFIRETRQGRELTTAPELADGELQRAAPFLKLFASDIISANFAAFINPNGMPRWRLVTPNTNVTDVSPLTYLAALRTLDLSVTQVADLAPLSGLADLRTLKLYATKIADLAPISRLTALQSLDISSTRVTELEPISRLAALHTLDVSSTRVADLALLSGLSALQSLDISSTRVTDLAPLSGLTALHTLTVSSTKVADLAPLSGLSALQSLDLSFTGVTDLSPLSALTALQSLYLSNTKVSDLAPISHLIGLQSIDLTDTEVTDIKPLTGLFALQELTIHRGRVTDFVPLSKITALRNLDLFQAQIEDLTPLSRHTGLQELRLFGTGVIDLAPISRLTELVLLSLSQTKISDLAPLSGLTRLRSLDLGFTSVTDLSPLSALLALESLDLGHTSVVDLTPLYDLPTLTNLTLPEISSEEVERLRRARVARGLPITLL
jgi:Leucine-rich repeat (LRR) protein